jgi:polyisoprenoid-binding protein YceI
MNLRHMIVAVTVAALSAVSLADTYTVDQIHSSILFKVKHADAANFYGMFRKVEGAVVTNGDAVKSVTVRIDAESIDTRNKDRDDHVRGPDFFDTKQFPDIIFTSKEVKAVDGGFEVTGDLTLHGTTKPQTLKLVRTGAGKNVQGKDVIGVETSFTIKRSDFGVSGYVGKGVGDEVTLIISIECVKQ